MTRTTRFLSRLSTATVILAFAACSEPMAPEKLVPENPAFAPGENLTYPEQQVFGSGVDTVGDRDTRVRIQPGGAGAFMQPYVLTPNIRWITPIAGTQWIGPTANANEFYTYPLGDDVYEADFTIPANATGPVLNVQLWADNAATVYVNGAKIAEQEQVDNYNYYGCLDTEPAETCTTFATEPFKYWTAPGDGVPWNIGGVNTIRIVVANVEYKQECDNVPEAEECESATGLNFRATVHYEVSTPGLVGCTPGFWQGRNNGALLWDQSPVDLQWQANGGVGSAPFIHETLFNSYFTAHASLNGLTMYQLVSTGGGPTAARRAARSLVAAYLNTSIGLNTGYTLAQLEQKWTAAVAAGDASLNALHEELDAANNRGTCDLTVNR